MDEGLNDLNEHLRDWVLDHHSALSNPEDISTRILAQTFREVVVNVLDTARASSVDKSWKILKYGEEHINLLSLEEQLQLASLWVEGRKNGDWERFASHSSSPSLWFPHE